MTPSSTILISYLIMVSFVTNIVFLFELPTRPEEALQAFSVRPYLGKVGAAIYRSGKPSTLVLIQQLRSGLGENGEVAEVRSYYSGCRYKL